MFHLTSIQDRDELQRNRGESFLLMNPDPGVRLRPKEQLDLAMSTGQGLMGDLEDVVRAISLVYQFDGGAGKVDYEIGSMLVTAEGFGMQAFLASLQLVQIWLSDDIERGDVFAVVSPGTASEHNLHVKIGMEDWEPPATLQLMRTKAGTPFMPGKRVLRASGSTFERAFESLRGWHAGGMEFRTPKGGELIELHLGWFTPDLLNVGI